MSEVDASARERREERKAESRRRILESARDVFFRDGFINEVWGAHNIHCIDTLAERRADALRRIADAQAELREIG